MKLINDKIVAAISAIENLGYIGKLGLDPDAIEVSNREIIVWSSLADRNINIYWNENKSVYEYRTYRNEDHPDAKRDLSWNDSSSIDNVLKLLYWVYNR